MLLLSHGWPVLWRETRIGQGAQERAKQLRQATEAYNLWEEVIKYMAAEISRDKFREGLMCNVKEYVWD